MDRIVNNLNIELKRLVVQVHGSLLGTSASGLKR
jgi:hypothetical protein